MTIKPKKADRTQYEKERFEEKLRWLKRKQEEEEAIKTLKYWLEHPEGEDDATLE